MANRPQKVGEYRAYINPYMVTVPSTFTLVQREAKPRNGTDTATVLKSFFQLINTWFFSGELEKI